MDAIRWFSEIGLADAGLVGGKGANLGELTQAGFPVPPRGTKVISGDVFRR